MAVQNPLKRYREENGLTQKALADLLGVTDVTISRWESGERLIGRRNMFIVAKKTKIPGRELRPDLAKLMGEVA